VSDHVKVNGATQSALKPAESQDPPGYGKFNGVMKNQNNDAPEYDTANSAMAPAGEEAESETATTKVVTDVPTQDTPKVSTMQSSYGGIPKMLYQDALRDPTLEKVVAKMTNVEQEMDSLRAYLETNDTDDKALLEWPLYSRYVELHTAVETLIQAVDDLDRYSNGAAFPSDWTHHHLAVAREISLSTSKATIFAMKVMSKKTGEYAQELEDPSLSPAAEDITFD
jgi:hypothetical protein